MFPAHIRKRLGILWSRFSPLGLLSLFTVGFLVLGSRQYSYGVASPCPGRRTARRTSPAIGSSTAGSSVDVDTTAEPAPENGGGGGGGCTRFCGSNPDAHTFDLCTSDEPVVRRSIAPLAHIHYILVNAFVTSGTIAVLLLAGFVPSCLLRMRGRLPSGDTESCARLGS